MSGFQDFVKNSDLSDDEKTLWGAVFGIAQQEHLDDLSRFVDGDSQKLKFLTDNLKKKVDAIIKQDKPAADEILEEEKSFLEQ